MEAKAEPKPQKSFLQKIKENKNLAFINKHKFSFALLLALLVVFIFFTIKTRNLEKEHFTKQQKLIEYFDLAIDSLQISNVELAVKAFSWAVRSELLRDNIEQVNQLMVTFVQEPGIVNVKLVNPRTAIVTLSTNKKEEGSAFENAPLLQTDEQVVTATDDHIWAITPIMGMNVKLGVLVVEVQKGLIKYNTETPEPQKE
jgi:Ca2+/Na+ antiporter